MKLIYLFSNFDEKEGFPKKLGDDIKKDMDLKYRNGYGKFLYLPTVPKDRGTSIDYLNITLEWFRKLGVEFEEVVMLNDDYSINEKKKQIEQSNLVFLSGGDTLNQHRFIKENKLNEALLNYRGILMGLSAGAINLGELSLELINPRTGEYLEYEGARVIGQTITPHYEINNDILNPILKEKSKKMEIYGMVDDSAIRLEKDFRNFDKAKIYGDIFLVKDEKIKKL